MPYECSYFFLKYKIECLNLDTQLSFFFRVKKKKKKKKKRFPNIFFQIIYLYILNNADNAD